MLQQGMAASCYCRIGWYNYT